MIGIKIVKQKWSNKYGQFNQKKVTTFNEKYNDAYINGEAKIKLNNKNIILGIKKLCSWTYK